VYFDQIPGKTMQFDAETFSQSSYQLTLALAAFEKERQVEVVRVDESADSATITIRDLFCEVVALGLGNLYNKIPLPSPLYDATVLRLILADLEEAEASVLAERTEEWLRYEGLVRIMAGRRNQYVLTSRAISVLSVATAEGSLGVQLSRACACYAQNYSANDMRVAVRRLVMTILSAMNS
jgi:hypothetical protein